MDFFALLEEPRRPWLEPEALREKFLALSAQVHPDRVHTASEPEKRVAQQRYTDLNAAYNCLREPKDRLQHLLELELGAKPHQLKQIPAELMTVFMEVGQLCRQTDVFLAEKAKTTSPLLHVQMFERGQEWAEKLVTLQHRLKARRDTLLEELRTLDENWEEAVKGGGNARVAVLNGLEELYRLFAYFSRWSVQLQERLVQLSL
jgi:DnaJ-domain-containing protein 1